MKSHRRQAQSRKNSRQTQQRNKNKSKNQNQNQQRNNQNQNQQRNNRKGKASQKNSKQSKRNTRSQKRLQKHSRNNRVTRKNQRSQKQKQNQKQRKNRAKKSQSGGYGSWSLSEIQSILPCSTVTNANGNQVSVPNFDTSADASSKICSETIDILDAEQGADDSVSVISDLQNFTPGGTTEVIAAGSTGDGRTQSEQNQLARYLAEESRYQNLGRMVAPYPTRNASQDAKFTELGRNATERWNALTAAEFTGVDGTFETPVATSPA
jgi:flagellar biosynthesis GTPase FlhF